MSTKSNGGASSRNIRLIMGIIALLVGFAVGWFANNGSVDATAPADVVQQQVQERSGSDQQTDTDDAQASTQTDPSSSDGADAQQTETGTQTTTSERGPTIDEDGWYTTKEEVALYIHTYGRLPGNFISKTKARDRGWVASEGNLNEVCPGMSIGGSRFYNDDGQLPDKKGRQWTECDINYHGGHRGAERIVFSNDGLIFYTADHYETFEQLY